MGVYCTDHGVTLGTTRCPDCIYERDSMSETHESFDQWAIVDVMGHQRYVGRVTEQVIAGQGFVRVDVPKTDSTEPWTKIIGTSSIYSITPVSEDIARSMANKRRDEPVYAYELTQKMISQGNLYDDDGVDAHGHQV